MAAAVRRGRERDPERAVDARTLPVCRGSRRLHATLNRWVAKYSPLIANNARRRRSARDTPLRPHPGHSGQVPRRRPGGILYSGGVDAA